MGDTIIVEQVGPTATIEFRGGDTITVQVGGGAVAENGLPVGGDTGQILAKSSADDFAAAWVDPPADGVDGLPGADGADGVGVPAGGTTGQVLAKASDTDFDTAWVDAAAGGGGGADTAPAAYFPSANKYIANMKENGVGGSVTLGAGYIRMCGIRFDRNITVSDAGLTFTGAGANARIVVYKQRADDETVADLVYEGANLVAASAYVAAACDLTFEAGALYLIGCTNDASIGMSSVTISGACLSFGISSGTNGSSEYVTYLAHTFADPAPSTVPIPGLTIGLSGGPLVKFKVVSSTAG